MLAVTRRIKRKPQPVRTVSSESLYNHPAVPRQRIKLSQRRAFTVPRLRSTTSPRPFSLLRNMQIKRRRRKFQPKPQTEAPFVEVKVSKKCDDEMKSAEDIADNEVKVVSKLQSKPIYQAENMRVIETSPKVILEPDTAANSSEREEKTEDRRSMVMFEEHEVKNQIQDKISLMVDDETDDDSGEEYNDKTFESIINNSEDDENLIIEDSKLEIDS